MPVKHVVFANGSADVDKGDTNSLEEDQILL